MAPKNTSFKIILGSASMSRRRILAEMGYAFTIMTADIDEQSIRKEKAEELVMALAEAKADAIMSWLKTSGHFGEEQDPTLLITADTEDAIMSWLKTSGHFGEEQDPTLLITADTVVVSEGKIREKPSSMEEAREFIKGYSGGHALVVGSIVVTNLKTGIRRGGYDIAEVYFHDIPDEIIDNLIEEGVVFNVAGGLMLEHPLTSRFVDTVVGTADSIMGLSKSLTEKLIQEAL